MKIIDTDNFFSDYPDESVVAEGIKSQEYAEVICEALNEKFSGKTASRYYRVVCDDYKLIPGFEP